MNTEQVTLKESHEIIKNLLLTYPWWHQHEMDQNCLHRQTAESRNKRLQEILNAGDLQK
jgi:hypothetical protein